MFGCGEMGKVCGRYGWFGWLVSASIGLAGCGHAFPVAATFRGDASANVVADATFKGCVRRQAADGRRSRGDDGHGSPARQVAGDRAHGSRSIDVDGLLAQPELRQHVCRWATIRWRRSATSSRRLPAIRR